MFTILPAVHYIEAAEQDIVALYRSKSAATSAPSGMKRVPSEAFICAVKHDADMAVYLAYLDSDAKQYAIFTPQEGSQERHSYEELLDEALRFMDSLGFTMEDVSLSYSKALREVIVRAVRVIRAPREDKKSVQGKSSASKHGGESTPARQGSYKPGGSGSPVARVGQPIPVVEKETGKKSASGMIHDSQSDREKYETERGRLLAEKDAAEHRATEHAKAARLATEKVEIERAEREKLLVEKSAAEKREAEHAEAARLAQEQADAERAERQRLLAEKELMELRAAEQAKVARLAKDQADAERAERQRLLAEKALMEQQEAEQAEAARLAQAQADAERAEEQKLLAEKALMEQRAAEQAEAARRAQEQADAERAEEQKLLAEKALMEQRSAEQTESARRQLELSRTARAEVERLLADKVASEIKAMEIVEESRATLNKIEGERAEAERLHIEKALAEQHAVEAIESARRLWERAESERVESELILSGELATEQQAAEQVEESNRLLERAGSERAELEQILADKVAVEQQSVELLELAQQELKRAEAERIAREGSLAEEWKLDSSHTEETEATVLTVQGQTQPDHGERKISIADMDEGKLSELEPVKLAPTPAAPSVPLDGGTKETSPFYDPFQSEPEVTFSIDTSLESIVLERKESVRELYCSSNVARAMMAGYPSQNCSAFLCVVEKQAASHIYVAFYLTESKVVLVYRPDKQPQSPEECAEIVGSAIGFIETVGIILENVAIAAEGELEQVMERIPVLRRVLVMHR